MPQRITEDTPQYILNKSMDTNTNTLAVVNIGQDINDPNTWRYIQTDANGMLQTTMEGYKTRIEYSGSNPLYVGFALPGTAEDTAGWAIRKMTASGSNITETNWCDGDTKFDNKWSERADPGHTYS